MGTEVVKLLLDKGAKVDFMQDTYVGHTALMLASENGHVEVVTLLLDKGANVDLQWDYDGKSALMLVSENGHAEVVEILLDKGAKLDLQDDYGMTSLMLASENGHAEVVKILLDKGAKLDLQDTDGRTALMRASQMGNTEFVKILLDRGAKLDLQDKAGETALMIASRRHAQIVWLLLEKGSNSDLKDNQGNKALDHADDNEIKALLTSGISIITDSPETDSFTDSRDSTTYKTVRIGDQWWMAENLNAAHFRNGDPIPEAKWDNEWIRAEDEGNPAWCYYGYDPANEEKYGKLYNWYAVNDPRGLAPEGWHVTSDDDWKELEMTLGMSQSEANSDSQDRGTDEGRKLKMTYGWGTLSYSTSYSTNSSGFSALPGGYRIEAEFISCGDCIAGFWSSTENSENTAWNRRLSYNHPRIERYGQDDIQGLKGNGFSVRCIKN